MKINSRTVLIITVSLSTISVIRQSLYIQGAVTIVTLMLIIMQQARQVMLLRVFGRLKHLWIAVFSILILQIVFRQGGDVYFSFYLIKITETGVFYGISVALRLINLILISGLLFNIPSSEYMLAFKAWRFPYEISFLITTVIRFIPDYYRMFLSYKESFYLRNIELKRLSLHNKLKAIIMLLLTVLADNLADVKKRAIALELRAFRLYPARTYLYSSKLKLHDYLIQIIAFVSLLLMLFFL